MLGDTTFWAATAAVAASVSALLAAIYTYLTFRLVRSQGEPNVVVYVRHDESRPSLLQIVIENIGRGLATDLRFSASRQIPVKAWGLSEADVEPAQTMQNGPLIDGIRLLGPGDSRKISWGQYHGLKKILGDEPITLTCEYKNGKRRMPAVTATLEVRSFEGTDAVGSENTRIIKQLERIADTLEVRNKLNKPNIVRVPASDGNESAEADSE